MAITQVRHDGFARLSLYRQRIPDSHRTCAECGQPARFRYVWWADDRFAAPSFALAPAAHCFCSIGCGRSYGAC